MAGLTWDEIDGDTWKLLGDRAKTGSGHSIPLSPQAMEVLAECPHHAGSGIVFTASGNMLGGWHQFKMRINKKIGEQRGEPVLNWRFHDLRRSAATGIRTLGFDRLIVSKILNHRESGQTQVYDRFADDLEQRRALDRWAQHVAAVVSGKPAPSNVVELAKA